MTIEEVLTFEEMQIFDRKSISIEPKALAIPLVAFANADGGTIAIGISDKEKRIEGIDFEVQRLNELLRVPFDFCNPTINVQLEKVPCTDYKGRENHVLLMHIDPSPQVHANQADEVYLRVGDKSKLLKFDERLQLTYDKGERYFEDKPVPDAGIDDIDMDLVTDYINRIGYNKSALEYLQQNKGFIKEKDGTFVTDEEYPKFVRQELIVNAVTHRAYSISGTDIQVKMFDDHIVVESPGKLPGLVRADNIRYTHFSRNPKIAEYLKAYNFVKEYGEGVDRMCKELEAAGLNAPEYHTNAFMLQTVIYNSNKLVAIDAKKVTIEEKKVAIESQKVTKEVFESLLRDVKYSEPTAHNLLKIYDEIETNQVFGASEAARILELSYSGARKVLGKLIDMNVLVAVKGKGKGKYRFLNSDEIN